MKEINLNLLPIELDETIKFDESYYQNTSIIKMDELGICVIPIEIRKELKINENDTFKICIKDNKIILIKNHNK